MNRQQILDRVESDKANMQRVTDLQSEGKNPFVIAMEEARLKGDDTFLRYVLSRKDIPILRDNASFQEVQKAELPVFELIYNSGATEKPFFAESVFDIARKRRDVKLGRWAMDRGAYYMDYYVVQDINHSLPILDKELLNFLTDLGYVKGIIDPATRDIYENIKLAQAYQHTNIKVPRYSLTNRPIIHMKYAGNQCRKNGDYLPVSRYEGLYYSGKINKPKDVCGTFYFYEPESDNLLDLGKYLVAANKLHAMWLLEPKIDITDSITSEALFEYPFAPKLFNEDGDEVKSVYRTLSDTSTYDVEQYNRAKKFMSQVLITEDDLDKYKIDVDIRKPDRINPLFIGEHGYYGAKYDTKSDYLDQDVCKLARAAGYDTVIFQRELGTRRAVTEILDTRPKDESYKNICTGWEIDLNPSKKYPYIWFVDQGFASIE